MRKFGRDYRRKFKEGQYQFWRYIRKYFALNMSFYLITCQPIIKNLTLRSHKIYQQAVTVYIYPFIETGFVCKKKSAHGDTPCHLLEQLV